MWKPGRSKSLVLVTSAKAARHPCAVLHLSLSESSQSPTCVGVAIALQECVPCLWSPAN